jgi:hypothetical protein
LFGNMFSAAGWHCQVGAWLPQDCGDTRGRQWRDRVRVNGDFRLDECGDG